MKKELQEKLFKAGPNLYKNKDKSPQETCMCWGITCGDGWFDILMELTLKLEPLVVEQINENPESPSQPLVRQVKEKFGGLRFYMDWETDKMSKYIKEAEDKAIVTCEWCGNPGYLQGQYWVNTLCDDCQIKNENGYRQWRDKDE